MLKYGHHVIPIRNRLLHAALRNAEPEYEGEMVTVPSIVVLEAPVRAARTDAAVCRFIFIQERGIIDPAPVYRQDAVERRGYEDMVKASPTSLMSVRAFRPVGSPCSCRYVFHAMCPYKPEGFVCMVVIEIPHDKDFRLSVTPVYGINALTET